MTHIATKLVSENLVPGPGQVKLELVFSTDHPEDLAAVHGAIKQALADGKITVQEDVSIVAALLPLFSPDLAGRLGMTTAALHAALADGRISLPEGLGVAFTLPSVFIKS